MIPGLDLYKKLNYDWFSSVFHVLLLANSAGSLLANFAVGHETMDIRRNSKFGQKRKVIEEKTIGK